MSEKPDGTPKPDLRRSEHEDFRVRVSRDLSGSSPFLARGSKTHYSTIRFTLEPEPDGEAEAETGTSGAGPVAPEATGAAPAPEPAEAAPPPGPAGGSGEAAEPTGSIRELLGKWLGLDR